MTTNNRRRQQMESDNHAIQAKNTMNFCGEKKKVKLWNPHSTKSRFPKSQPGNYKFFESSPPHVQRIEHVCILECSFFMAVWAKDNRVRFVLKSQL